MLNKPMISCPHCAEHIAAERLPLQRKYRNEYGLDVFECPECQQNFKFDPSEYFVIRKRIEKGYVPDGAVIEGAKADELMPSERMAFECSQAQKAPWRGFAKVVLVVGGLLFVYFLFR